MATSRKGTPIRKIARPTKTPATVRRNCFIGSRAQKAGTA
jgi:hypothetical protein